MAIKFFAWRVVALVAFALSAVSLAEGLRGSPLFCPLSGCEAVARSAFARPLGVPLPWVGVVGFGAFFLLALFPTAGVARVLGPAALAAGFAGLGLVAVQAMLSQFCQLCLLVDASAMLLALVELIWNAPEGGAGPPARPAWLAALALAGAAPFVASGYFFPEPPTPEEVLALQQPGVVTVVFVTDFECEQCRGTHPTLRRLVDEYPRVRLVLKVFPLPKHKHSRDAARAYFAAEEMGKGPEMAEALLEADDLSPAGCERLAGRLGLGLKRYRELVGGPRAEARLGETEWMKQARVPGLPAIWVGRRRLTGLVGEEALREAIEGQLALLGGSDE